MALHMSDELKQVTIYTDGACDPNPGGPGGYGVVLKYGDKRKELSGGFQSTTNNRMEVYAAIVGLEALKAPCKITLYSDSKYLVDAMTQGWVRRWKQNDWWRNREEKAVNVDLWERLLSLCDIHQIEFVWVKGHAGDHENERCDKLSLEALKREDLLLDEGYEQRPESGGKTAITYEGQPCRKCATPVIKRIPRKKPKQSQLYYFEYYLYCPKCHTMYMVEAAKRFFEDRSTPSLL
jgi:ribonuclease HI